MAESFLHGIGGGKYDELTDELLRRFYGVEPPRFLVLSATLLLPLRRFSATEEERRSVERELRVGVAESEVGGPRLRHHIEPHAPHVFIRGAGFSFGRTPTAQVLAGKRQ